MSKTAFILIGVAYYIITMVVIITTLELMSRKEKRKFETDIKNLERDKNLIISAGIMSELNRVEPLVNNSETKEIYEEWQRRFKEIKDVEVPYITDSLLELEE